MLQSDELSRDFLLILRADTMLDIGLLTPIVFKILKVMLIGFSDINSGIPVINISSS